MLLIEFIFDGVKVPKVLRNAYYLLHSFTEVLKVIIGVIIGRSTRSKHVSPLKTFLQWSFYP